MLAKRARSLLDASRTTNSVIREDEMIRMRPIAALIVIGLNMAIHGFGMLEYRPSGAER